MYLLELLFGFGCLGEGVPGCLITKSDLILDFEDTNQGLRPRIKRLERVEAEGTMY